MKNLNVQAALQNEKYSNFQTTNVLKRPCQIIELFEDKLKAIYWTEKSLIKVIPAMITNATCPDLKEALKIHLSEALIQILRLEQVFEFFGKKAVAKKCLAMEGLIAVAAEKMDSCTKGPLCDSGIISIGRKMEHYEIESYETLCQIAESLCFDKVLQLLQSSLYEEMAAHERLSEIAFSALIVHINMEEEADPVKGSLKVRTDFLHYA
ncbi:MAG: DUF892 family protein [Saprospiraceae bacterium]|nr:DUF892 family protein [Saprospiraceae bacterium]